MKKVILGLVIVIAVIALVIGLYFFQQDTVEIGIYTVVYHKNQCDIDPAHFPRDMESLKSLPCLVRITWQQQISSDMFQEYCYLPGKEVEKTRTIHKTL
jgi:hypothetical protein